MNIPDKLRGKEANPFIEWYRVCQDYCDKYVAGLPKMQSHIKRDLERSRRSDLYNSAKKVRAFLSSPFEPEKIPEIFDGWEVCGSDFFEIVNKHHSVIMDYYPREGKMIFYDYGVEVSTTNPKTWDQFVSDCKRVGITLAYK